MQKAQITYNRTSSDYVLTNSYASEYAVRAVEIPQSTSADGWKYHKRSKHKRK